MGPILAIAGGIGNFGIFIYVIYHLKAICLYFFKCPDTSNGNHIDDMKWWSEKINEYKLFVNYWNQWEQSHKVLLRG